MNIQLYSIHGLFKPSPELGINADTGGQVKYVLELAKALGEQGHKVDVFTRLIQDDTLDAEYSRRITTLSENCRIVRIPCGGSEFIEKEHLWLHLSEYTANAIAFIEAEGTYPDVIHGHYADSGYVAKAIAKYFKKPFIFTGHSLGRWKQARFLEDGAIQAELERLYNISYRISIEEEVIGSAARIIASSKNEIYCQYSTYKAFDGAVKKMVVNPPGVSLCDENCDIDKELARFLRDMKKPIILAVARPVKTKNIKTIVEAYGVCPEISKKANLVLLLGQRDDITKFPEESKEIIKNVLCQIDKYDLYGKVAIPKMHTQGEVRSAYSLTRKSHGAFVNLSLAELFGLTTIEAALSGIPVVATNQGGPCEVVTCCQSGILVDPLNTKAVGDALTTLLNNKAMWNGYSANGIKNASRLFKWESHVNKYLECLP
jgi:sucrose-phosphate synthase